MAYTRGVTESENRPNPFPAADAEVASDEKWFFRLLGIAALMMGLVGGTYVYYEHRTPVTKIEAAEIGRKLPEFTLTERSGRKVTRDELKGNYVIASTVFAACSLTCLQVNYRMEEIQRLVANQADVRLVSFSIDPLSDTPSALSEFAQRFHADPNRWLFLTGDRDTLYPLIENTLLGPADFKLLATIPGGFANTERIALIDPEGVVRGFFNGLPGVAPAQILQALEQLRARSR